jgi:hypothetical protein
LLHPPPPHRGEINPEIPVMTNENIRLGREPSMIATNSTVHSSVPNPDPYYRMPLSLPYPDPSNKEKKFRETLISPFWWGQRRTFLLYFLSQEKAEVRSNFQDTKTGKTSGITCCVCDPVLKWELATDCHQYIRGMNGKSYGQLNRDSVTSFYHCFGSGLAPIQLNLLIRIWIQGTTMTHKKKEKK